MQQYVRAVHALSRQWWELYRLLAPYRKQGLDVDMSLSLSGEVLEGPSCSRGVRRLTLVLTEYDGGRWVPVANTEVAEPFVTAILNIYGTHCVRLRVAYCVNQPALLEELEKGAAAIQAEYDASLSAALGS